MLEPLGWQGELIQARYSLRQLRELASQCPCNAVFDWRASADEAVEIVEAIVPDPPREWAKGARSVGDVQRAAQRAMPDMLWKLWEDSESSDTRVYLVVRARVWRQLEDTWLPEVLAGIEAEEELPLEDRGAQVRQVAERALEQLVASDALELTDRGEAAAPELKQALAAKLRTLYLGNPVLGPMLSEWFLSRPEVEELYWSDDEVGALVKRIWKNVLDHDG